MKASLKTIAVLIVSSLWILLLRFVDRLLEHKWNGGGLPPPWGEIAAVALALGPPFLACVLVLRRSYPLRSLHAALRWTIYFLASAALSVVALFGGSALGMAFGLSN